MRLIAVAVPVPFLDGLTYAVPDGWPLPPVGARVLVPLGTRTLTGCVVDDCPPTADAGDAGAIEAKAILRVVDADPLVDRPMVDLCRWVATYYVCGIGDALTPALPPGARSAEHDPDAAGEPSRRRPSRVVGVRTRRVASITAHGLACLPDAPSREGVDAAPNRDTGREANVDAALQAAGAGLAVSRAPADSDARVRPLSARQMDVLQLLSQTPQGLAFAELRDRGFTADIVTRLASRGCVAVRTERDERDPFERAALPAVALDAARSLSPEQAEALRVLGPLVDAAAFRVALLRGVTGSGKTEVYLRLAQRACAAGRQVLLMVPEIALTPAMAALFRGAFGGRVAIQHSALSDGERHDQWYRIRRGEIDVVVGTRSAVFAPLAAVGLIVVDEEHDSSYKQEETPRYHGRDVAVMRASRCGAVVILGSATPSMESFQNALTGKYDIARLERRVLERPLASVRVVNMREEYADAGPDVVISRALAEGVDERLARREQVVVLLNRRGYATAVFCRQCGDTFECPNCSVSLTVHTSRGGRPAVAAPAGRVQGQARCHYCNYAIRIPSQCRKCAAPYLEQAGYGTEKVELQLRERFPDARIGRVDRDSVRRKGALASLLSQFARGDLDVLVGTQMIAKGHDFPRVTLVGVISADVGLGMADFRAAERTFQLLTQVAGRAGRGERPGEAIVQTLFPEHYSIRLACAQDYTAFFDKELQFRKAMLYPPMVAMINVVVRGRTLDEALSAAGDIVRRLQPAASSVSFRTLGPAPAPLVRLRGEHRAQLFLKGTRRAEMRQALAAVLAEVPELRRRVTVDVDPLNVL